MSQHVNKSKGRVEVICGVMFGGKTEALLSRIRSAAVAKQKIFVFKPEIDIRYGKCNIQSHLGTNHIALPVSTSDDILDIVTNFDGSVHVVAIDEAQFFDYNLVYVVRKLSHMGIRVIVAGLDNDFRREPFGPMPLLMCIAHEVEKKHATCVVCGDLNASCTQRIINGKPAHYDDPIILVAGQDAYEARCDNCFECPGHPIYDD